MLKNNHPVLDNVNDSARLLLVSYFLILYVKCQTFFLSRIVPGLYPDDPDRGYPIRAIRIGKGMVVVFYLAPLQLFHSFHPYTVFFG